MTCNHHRFFIAALAVLGLSGCANLNDSHPLTDMQAIALCRGDAQALETEKKITAEYGYRQFAANAYRPQLEQQLFGHQIRVIEVNSTMNKLYVAGHLSEFAHHFGQILPDLVCEENDCQAPLSNGQSLIIYKPKIKKAKNTTVIECTKAPTE